MLHIREALSSYQSSTLCMHAEATVPWGQEAAGSVTTFLMCVFVLLVVPLAF